MAITTATTDITRITTTMVTITTTTGTPVGIVVGCTSAAS